MVPRKIVIAIRTGRNEAENLHRCFMFRSREQFWFSSRSRNLRKPSERLRFTGISGVESIAPNGKTEEESVPKGQFVLRSALLRSELLCVLSFVSLHRRILGIRLLRLPCQNANRQNTNRSISTDNAPFRTDSNRSARSAAVEIFR